MGTRHFYMILTGPSFAVFSLAVVYLCVDFSVNAHFPAMIVDSAELLTKRIRFSAVFGHSLHNDNKCTVFFKFSCSLVYECENPEPKTTHLDRKREIATF
jgi:hypothetical protein